MTEVITAEPVDEAATRNNIRLSRSYAFRIAIRKRLPTRNGVIRLAQLATAPFSMAANVIVAINTEPMWFWLALPQPLSILRAVFEFLFSKQTLICAQSSIESIGLDVLVGLGYVVTTMALVVHVLVPDDIFPWQITASVLSGFMSVTHFASIITLFSRDDLKNGMLEQFIGKLKVKVVKSSSGHEADLIPVTF